MQNRNELLAEQEIINKSPDTKPSPMYKIEHVEIVQNKVQAHKINGNVSQKTGLSASEIRKLFKSIYEQINSRQETSNTEKKAIKASVKEIEEILAAETPEPKFLQTRLKTCKKWHQIFWKLFLQL